jgi:hypothetical protein
MAQNYDVSLKSLFLREGDGIIRRRLFGGRVTEHLATEQPQVSNHPPHGPWLHVGLRGFPLRNHKPPRTRRRTLAAKRREDRAWASGILKTE